MTSHISFIANIMEAVSPVVQRELAKAWDDLDAANRRLAEIRSYAEAMSCIGDGSIGDQLLAVVDGRAVFNDSGFVVGVR